MAGAGLSTPPVSLLNTMNAVSQKYFSPVLADSVFKPSPTYWRLTRMGKKMDGGAAIVWPVATTEETSGGAYYGTQILDTTVQDSIQPAELQWKYYYQTIAIPVTDLLLNAGRTQVISLLRTKQEMAMGSLLQKLSRAIYNVSPNNTSLALDSLPGAMAASGTYAGITIASGTWRSNGGAGPTTVSAALSMTNMQTLYGTAVYGNEEPDTCVTTQAIWNQFWVLCQALQRYQKDEETTRAGFKNHLMFNNAVVLHDQFVPSGEMYFLTSKYAAPVFMERDYFVVEPFVRPTNQRVIASQVFVALNLRLLTLRQHARAISIT